MNALRKRVMTYSFVSASTLLQYRCVGADTHERKAEGVEEEEEEENRKSSDIDPKFIPSHVGIKSRFTSPTTIVSASTVNTKQNEEKAKDPP